MLATLENRSKRNAARIGLLGLGIGLYSGIAEILLLSTVVNAVIVVDLILTWKENKE